MGRSFLIISLCFVLLNCAKQRPENKAIISSLETIIDSIANNNDPVNANIFVDSLIRMDPDNYVANRIQGLIYFNDYNTKESIKYFLKALKVKSNDSYTILLTAWSYERENQIDSARKYYSSLMPLLDGSSFGTYYKPKILTILKGQSVAVEEVAKTKNDFNELQYYQLLNDINRYQNDGLSVFFPLFFDIPDSNNFHINIPDSLYNSGEIDSIDEVETFFAKLGINITVKSSTGGREYEIYTSDKYLEQLLELDAFGIKKL